MKRISVVSALAVGSAAALCGTVRLLKNKHICPVCEVKKAVSNTQVHVKASCDYSNGVALTPPMGWSSWNTFGANINEKIIYETALAMKNSGLSDAGYKYINIDDCWESSARDDNGRLQADFSTFPSGIKNLCKRVNDLGLKLGIYSSNGTKTCEGRLGTLYHERIDAETFADWGIEYFKYDFCHHEPIPTKAPFIDKITVENFENGFSLTLQAEDGILTGKAKIVDDSKLETGKMVIGLSNNEGVLSFNNVAVPSDAEYVLTVHIRKMKKSEKYLELTVDNCNKFPMLFESAGPFSVSGMYQLKLRLEKGNHTLIFENPFRSKKDTYAAQYINMGKELKRATAVYAEEHGCDEKPIVYSICEWGLNKPWKWGRQAGNLWRTTPDIKPYWASVVGIYEVNVRLWKYSGAGAYNDPDMLEVGNGNLTRDENISHVTLWCMMNAPLILGNDLRKYIRPDGSVDTDNPTLKIVTNKNLISVNQDKRCIQCKRVKTDLIHDILVKPLENNELALCFFNKGNREAKMKTDISFIRNNAVVDLPDSLKYQCVDLWDETVFETDDTIEASVPSHGVKVYRIKAV